MTLPAENRLNQIVEKLRDTDHRITPQRMEILKALVNEPRHPTADEIYATVKETFPMISLATVYKTVNLLVDMGEVIEIDRGHGKAHYDALRPNAHPHLVCIACDEVVDVEMNGIAELYDQVEEITTYEVLSHRLDFFGLCPQCQEK
jgi:Fur family peroxide stress response transcriptional regulator